MLCLPHHQVVASIVHEKLVGVDVAVRTVVPPRAKLQGRSPRLGTQAGAPPAAMPAPPAAAGSLMEPGQEVPAKAAETVAGQAAAVPGVRKPRKSGMAAEKPGREPAGAGKNELSQAATRQAASAAAAPPNARSSQTAALDPPLGPPLQPAVVAGLASPLDSSSKWRKFVGAARQEQARNDCALQQLSLQQSLQRSAAKAEGRATTQACGFVLRGKPAGHGLAAGQTHSPTLAPGAENLPPAMPAAATVHVSQGSLAEPGRLFARFAFRGGPVSNQTAAPKAATAASHLAPRGLRDRLPAEQAVAPEAGQLAPALRLAGNKRKLDGTAAGEAAARTTAAQPAGAPPIPPSRLVLPKLNWLSFKFDRAAANTPSADQPAQAAAGHATEPANDFNRLFSFL